MCAFVHVLSPGSYLLKQNPNERHEVLARAALKDSQTIQPMTTAPEIEGEDTIQLISLAG